MRRIQAFLPEAEGGPELAAAFARVGWDKLAAALPSLKGRAKTLKELVDGAGWLIAARPLALDDKAAKALDAGARALLARLVPQLEAAPAWDASTLEGLVRAFSEAEGAKLGAIAQPLRAALTGKAVSPPVFDMMAALGRAEALARIRDQAR
jgi:glutamyl-tRNA synthetase